MAWLTKTIDELRPGDVLVSMGGRRWSVLSISEGGVFVLDLDNDRYDWSPHRRDYWRYGVEE